MSNLGNYQRLVQLAKVAHGPVRLGLYVVGGALAAGTVIGTVAGPAIKSGIAKAASKVTGKQPSPSRRARYAVNSDADGGGGLRLRVGDEFIVLNRDGDAVLISITGNSANPWVVSADVLADISNFPIGGN